MAITKKFQNFIFLSELFSKRFSFELNYFSVTDLLGFINFHLRPSSIGKCLFKVDALGTLFPDDTLTLGVHAFPEYVGWSLEGWNVDLTAGLLDRLDFSNLSVMFRGDLDLELFDFGILYVFPRRSRPWPRTWRSEFSVQSTIWLIFTIDIIWRALGWGWMSLVSWKTIVVIILWWRWSIFLFWVVMLSCCRRGQRLSSSHYTQYIHCRLMRHSNT